MLLVFHINNNLEHENANHQNEVMENDKLLIPIKDYRIVIKDKFIVLFKVKKVDDTIAGIINKIAKGLVIPPVKYNNIAN